MEVVLSWLRGWLLDDPMAGNRIRHHATQTGEFSLDCQKISVTSSLTSGRLTPLIAISLVIMYGVWLDCQQNSVKQLKWTKGKDDGSIYQFKHVGLFNSLLEIPKSFRSYSWRQWRFLGINLIYSITRCYHVILINIIDKVRCQSYFHFV